MLNSYYFKKYKWRINKRIQQAQELQLNLRIHEDMDHNNSLHRLGQVFNLVYLWIWMKEHID